MFPGSGFWGAIGRIASKHIKVVTGTRSAKTRPKILNSKDEEESMNATENESDQEEMDTKEGTLSLVTVSVTYFEMWRIGSNQL